MTELEISSWFCRAADKGIYVENYLRKFFGAWKKTKSIAEWEANLDRKALRTSQEVNDYALTDLSARFRIVDKWMKIPVIISVLSTVGANCPLGYSYYDMTQKCYKVSAAASPYFSAVDACRQDGGSLVSIHNVFENIYLANLISNNNVDYWIGLTNMMSGYIFEWTDDTPVQYTNWDASQPNYDAGCAFMKTGNAYWSSQTCRYFLPYICEYDPASAPNSGCPKITTCPPPPECPSAVCDDGWKYYGNTTFCYFIGKETLNNTVAQDRCAPKNSYLASIHSNAENAFILSRIDISGSPGRCWIGLYRSGPGPDDFENYDETPVDYTHWSPGNPSNTRGVEYCSEMVVADPWIVDGSWNDRPCFDTLPYYVCKKSPNKH